MFFKNPRNLKIPPEWQPCGNLAQNIAYVSAFIDPYPHMKFQVDTLSGSKVTEGDGRTDGHYGLERSLLDLKNMV